MTALDLLEAKLEKFPDLITRLVSELDANLPLITDFRAVADRSRH
jgi:hypothetical protein